MLRRCHIRHFVQMHYFFQNFLVDSGAKYMQTEYKVTKKRFYHKCNFMNQCFYSYDHPRSFLALGRRGPIGHMAILEKLLYSGASNQVNYVLS